MKPIVIVNLKTYQQGKETDDIVKELEKVDKNIIIGVQATDLYRVSQISKLPIFIQHVDYFDLGRNTGFILPEGALKNGAIGCFLNHSEHPLDLVVIEKTIKRCKSIGLKTAVFTKNLNEAKKIEKFSPNYLIYEPPELVAGNISVTTAKPEVILEIVKALKIPVLVGAGVKNNKDLKKCMELGAVGIALSSAITTAKEPGKVLRELLC
jgi:triosephosphate isomerase (TIM)